jgi:catechol 2,3-dioxygenase-like lactoylglutathione lyase family enzyme
MPLVRALDHLVLTVADPEATVAWYASALGLRRVEFGEGRLALGFGGQKINLHRAGHEIEPKAARPTPGSSDLCFLTASLAEVIARLGRSGTPIEVGPVRRAGATGPLVSIYLRDPDGNLVEVAEPVVGADHGA